jgi:hypothetical protein
MPATIQCRNFVFEITVSIYRTVIVPAQPQGDVHTVHHKYIYISLLAVLAFVENHRKGIKKYIIIATSKWFQAPTCNVILFIDHWYTVIH